MPKTSRRNWHGLWKTWLAQGAVFGRGRSRGSTDHRDFARSTDILEIEKPGANTLSHSLWVFNANNTPSPCKYSWIVRVLYGITIQQRGLKLDHPAGPSHKDPCSEVAQFWKPKDGEWWGSGVYHDHSLSLLLWMEEILHQLIDGLSHCL